MGSKQWPTKTKINKQISKEMNKPDERNKEINE